MSGKRIAREKMTIQRMISLYESQCPQASDEPGHYDALFTYAQKRLDKCVFGEEKPACKQCPVHCYQPAKREEMKQIIREEIEHHGVSVIIPRRECIQTLARKKRNK